MISNARFRPIADVSVLAEKRMMRCFFVMIHGRFIYHVNPAPSGVKSQGVFAARCLFAQNEADASAKALARVEKSLAKWNPDIRNGLISVSLDVEEVAPEGWWKAFYRANRGHVFYRE